jgi:hypothetical protein
LPEAGWIDVWNPVDEVARSVVQLLLRSASAGSIFHVADGGVVRLTDVGSWLAECGYPLPVVSWTEWVDAITADQDNPMALLLPHLLTAPGASGRRSLADALPSGDSFHVNAANLRAALGENPARVGPELLSRYLERMAEDGLIARPAFDPAS